MIEQSVERSDASRTVKGDQASPSTRELVADAEFCGLLAEDLGVKITTARTAFFREPKARCLKVVEWALRHEPDSPEWRAKLIIAWARKKQAGAFRDSEEAEQEIAQAVAAYWVHNPEKLAETLKAALASSL